ncbi:MAG TPA: AarF/ABC1/UbiB kinase family protein [Baekduia sp.]|nr:AarF/ABC1/UbiB kinase family protein [Baekduia sp.]
MADREKPSISSSGRTARVGRLVAGQGMRIAGGKALDRVRSEERRDRAQAERVAKVVEQIVVQLGQMKGAAMKVGQVLSTVDFPGMPEEDRERIKTKLAELRDNAPRVPFKDLEKLMAREWGEPVGRVLQDIDQEALAAASIGQVHRAVTRDGDEVAVKVQYPGIAEAVEVDLRNARMLIPLLGRIAPGLDTKALADELSERISEELDYELEASSHRRVHRWYRAHPHVRIPRVYTDLSTRRVLVTELVHGRTYDDMKAAPEAERDRLAELLVRFFLGTAVRFDVALGDPHPGNWLMDADGRLLAFDFGMLRNLPPHVLRQEGVVHAALSDGDSAELVRVMRELRYLTPDWDGDAELLHEYLAIAGEYLLSPDQPVRLGPEHQKQMMRRLFQLGKPAFDLLRTLDLPREAVLYRRQQDLLYTTITDLRGAMDWRAVYGELLQEGPAATPLGLEEADWARRAAG